jgi:hypothetical protein
LAADHFIKLYQQIYKKKDIDAQMDNPLEITNNKSTAVGT